MADVLGFATKATKSNPKAVAYSKGTQKSIDAIKTNAGPLSGVIGQGPDADYKAFQQKQTSLAKQIIQQKQQQEQVRKQAEDTAKQKSSLSYKATHNLVTDAAGGLAKGIVNTAKLPVQAAEFGVANVTKNPTARNNAEKALGSNYEQSIAKSFVDVGDVAYNQGKKQVKHLAGSTSTPAQRQAIISNQKTATQDPAFKETLRQFKDLPSDALIQAEKMRAKGAKTADIKNYLTTQQKAKQAQDRQMLGEAAAVSSLAVGGGSLARAVGGREIASSVLPTAVAGGAGSEGSVLATNPNATGKELSSAGLQGFVAGAVLPIAGHYVGKGAGEVKGRVSLPIGKPDLTAEKAAVASQVGQKVAGRMQLGKTAVADAVQPLMDEKAKLTQLKADNPAHAKRIDETITQVDKKIQDVQKITTKQAEDSQKVINKNAAEAKKIDQQMELIKAKKADTGKLSNIDQVKLKQLAARRQELAASLPKPTHSGAMPEAPPETVIHLTKQGIYAKASPAQIEHMRPEVDNIPTDSTDTVHLSPLNDTLQRGAKEVPLEDLLNRSPNAAKALSNVPAEAATKTSGVATSIEAKAVEKKLTTGFEGKAGYDPVTVKEQAAKATDLVKNDLEKAKAMANGTEPVPSDLRGAALITALEEHATKTGDVQLLKDLANSPLVAETSRHAQELRLLAEREQSSAVAKIREVAQARRQAVEKRLGKSIDKEVKRNARVVNTHLPAVKAKDWNDFISALKC